MKYQNAIISESLFTERLRNRPNEDISLIQRIEDHLKEKRGYVLRLPKAKTPVVLLASSGLDSTVVWDMLLRQYKYEVYPLFLHRHQGRAVKELACVQYFSRYFAKKYPSLSHPIHIFTAPLPPPEVDILKASSYPEKYYHPSTLIDQFEVRTTANTAPKLNEFTWTYPLYGMAYARFLENTKYIKIRSIFHGVTAGDGREVAQQSFTSLRITQLSICGTTNDYSWQICALPFEKTLGHWMEKSDLIQIGVKNNVPLERTWSCYKTSIVQCGDACLACASRRHEFHKAAVLDKTLYWSNFVLPYKIFMNRLFKKF